MLKALYGCEVAPANEVSLRTLATSISKTIAYTTSQRSADLTFAVASYGPDLDPDIHILSRGATAFRRYVTRNEENASKMKEIFEAYARKKEPGVYIREEQLEQQKLGGALVTVERAEARGECKPMGPCDYLLESIHLQEAPLTEKHVIRQRTQQVIELVDGPYQQIAPLTSRMAARNRTRRAEGTRLETSNLIEIDTYATNAKHKDEVKEEEEDRLIFKMMQAGSSWSKAVTQKTGMREDHICDLCKEAKETSDHIWYCSRLDEKRKELDA